jgi:hypothetical protein
MKDRNDCRIKILHEIRHVTIATSLSPLAYLLFNETAAVLPRPCITLSRVYLRVTLLVMPAGAECHPLPIHRAGAVTKSN